MATDDEVRAERALLGEVRNLRDEAAGIVTDDLASRNNDLAIKKMRAERERLERETVELVGNSIGEPVFVPEVSPEPVTPPPPTPPSPTWSGVMTPEGNV